MKKIILSAIVAVSGLGGMVSCANASKTADYAPEKEVPVSADVPGTATDTISNPDAEPIQP